MGRLVQTAEEMGVCLNALRQTKTLVYDVETSGLNPRKNHVVGYVLTIGPAPDETFYVPVRHGGGGNCLQWAGMTEPDKWNGIEDPARIDLHPFEIEFANIAKRTDLRSVGHNFCFDLLFSARKGIVFEGRVECTQVAMALINEWLPSFSLDSSARYMGVTEKLGQELYHHIYNQFQSEFKEGVFADKKMMAHFWRLAGNDPVGVDYATGDGVSTWELREAQQKEIDAQELNTVWDVECRVTKTLFRMQHYGIPISQANFERSMAKMQALIEEAKTALPAGINVMSALQLKPLFDKAGITDYPLTEKGNASFPEDWLSTNDLGQKVIALRKVRNLVEKFMNPLAEKYAFNWRVFPNYAQLGSDEFGTITGRLSSYEPNIQQVPKRNKLLGRIFRDIFVPEEGYLWKSNDYKQAEPRLYAEYSGAPKMIDGYNADPPVDFYELLSEITGKPRSPTAGIHGNCKQLALSIFYGAGDAKTAEMLGIPLAEAKYLRGLVRAMVPEIDAFAKRATRLANERGYVMTVLGRRCRFPKVTTNRFGKQEREFSFKAGGRIIQGGNADLIKVAMVNVDDYLRSEGCPPPFASVHDAIEAQYPEDKPHIGNEISRIMERTAVEEPIGFTRVKQLVDEGIGKTWGEATYGPEK